MGMKRLFTLRHEIDSALVGAEGGDDRNSVTSLNARHVMPMLSLGACRYLTIPSSYTERVKCGGNLNSASVL